MTSKKPEISNLFAKIREIPKIVEGKNDKISLRKIGFKNILPLNGRSLYSFAHIFSNKYNEALILTDFDSEGRKLRRKLNFFLQAFGVSIETKLREEIMRKVTQRGKSRIENLSEKDFQI